MRAGRPGVFPLGAHGAGRMAKTGSLFGCNAYSGQGGAFRQIGDPKIAAFVVVFLAYPAARAFEGASYLPDHLLLINAATALATVNRPVGLHAGRIPSLGFALFDLALYLAVFLGVGAWRAWRDA